MAKRPLHALLDGILEPCSPLHATQDQHAHIYRAQGHGRAIRSARAHHAHLDLLVRRRLLQRRRRLRFLGCELGLDGARDMRVDGQAHERHDSADGAREAQLHNRRAAESGAAPAVPAAPLVYYTLAHGGLAV